MTYCQNVQEDVASKTSEGRGSHEAQQLCTNIHIIHYRPQRSCEGYVFTPLCPRGGLPQCMLGYQLLWDQAPPPQTRHTPHPPGSGTPPPADGYCCRRYASYWNAFLFHLQEIQIYPTRHPDVIIDMIMLTFANV